MVSTSAWARIDCSSILGSYDSVYEGDPTLKISYDDTASTLNMEWGPTEYGPGRTDSYIMTGIVHRGDGVNVGDPYFFMHCGKGKFVVTGIFFPIPGTITNKFTLEGNTLSFTFDMIGFHNEPFGTWTRRPD
jgi:hypothetical protein